MGCGGSKTRDELIKEEIDQDKEKYPMLNYEIIKEALNKHNECRVKHKAPKLIHNNELSKRAQEFANTIAMKNTLQHSDCKWDNKQVGENLAWCSGTVMTGEFMTKMWYDEIKDYDYNNPTFTSNAGHFTQLIWKDSQEIGIGIAKCSEDGSWYAVANYYPAGNVLQRFKENVLPLADK